MSFSSPGFLFAFFPVFFLIYYAAPASARNAVLLVSSLAFYTIDGGYVTGVLVVSILVNQGIGRLLAGMRPGRARFGLLWLGIALNLVPLVHYKYWTFLVGVSHDALMPAGIQIMLAPGGIVLPAGISFFTFQGLSYLVDIYRGEIAAAPGLVSFGMYHTLFPQLIAGPIVRYIEIEDRVAQRPIALADVEAGILRFCWGLAKKIIIADSMGTLADRMFALPPGQLGIDAAWVGALAYTLQIYFDFSGYSDMAIGLGRMLGFKFPENFDLPYRSLSITEFWRRWHMTLSRWFRDYVYISLGGNRAGPVRTTINLFTVFLLCGLWHGAAYTFVVWGCYHGALLVIERLARRRGRSRPLPAVLGWPVTLLLVVVGWVVFRAPTLGAAVAFLAAMAGFGHADAPVVVAAFLTPDKLVFFAIGAALSVLPVGRVLGMVDLGSSASETAFAQRAAALLLFGYSTVLIAANGFNPFIYFRF